uniref:Uncharacterized protein AlNc14C147G7410 n=1 Tax=Albugo laibachii Nc14 TaxID=890382 RepID=F0WLM1_9STRA|nr:conserved hypothetical protein [Albugo laibachii Nc14]|eukprot:CCA22187.1 conserved hypothetical protein [Albugo laibachii Nc14]
MTVSKCKSHAEYRAMCDEGYCDPNHFETTGVQFQSDPMHNEDVPYGQEGTTNWTQMQPSHFTKHGAMRDNSSVLCLICYNNHANAILVPCHHRFHSDCIHTKLKDGHCPICLTRIQSLHQLIVPQGQILTANLVDDVGCGQTPGNNSSYLIHSSGYGSDTHPTQGDEAVQATEIMRRGKWTREESAYCDRLIDEFKNGNLALVEGTTLRAFLSKLLRCDPMRISKKYTGDQCIGKVYYNLPRLAYSCNLISDSAQIVFRRREHGISLAEIDKARHDLAKLEKAFLERDKLNRQRREKRLRCQYSDETNSPQIFRYTQTQTQIIEPHHPSVSHVNCMDGSHNVPYLSNTNTITNQAQTQNARVHESANKKEDEIDTLHVTEAKSTSLSTSVSAIALASLAQDSLNPPSCISQISSFENLVSLFPRVTSFDNFALLSSGPHIQSGLDITEVFSVSPIDCENTLEKKEVDFASHPMELILTNVHPKRANISMEPQDTTWKPSKSILQLSRVFSTSDCEEQCDDSIMEIPSENATSTRSCEMSRRNESSNPDSGLKKNSPEAASDTTSLEKLSRIASSDFLSRINSADHFTTFGTMKSTSSYGSLTNLVAFGRSCLPRTSSIEDILSLLAPSETSLSTDSGHNDAHERSLVES